LVFLQLKICVIVECQD